MSGSTPGGGTTSGTTMTCTPEKLWRVSVRVCVGGGGAEPEPEVRRHRGYGLEREQLALYHPRQSVSLCMHASIACLLLYEDYVWASLANAMKAKQRKNHPRHGGARESLRG